MVSILLSKPDVKLNLGVGFDSTALMAGLMLTAMGLCYDFGIGSLAFFSGFR